MKKITSFITAISIALCFFFVPFTVSATEGLYIDVLDYCTLDNSGTNSGRVDSSGSLTYDLTDTYGKVRCYSFDVLFSYSGNSNFNIDSLYFGDHSVDFEFEIFTSGLCRVTGNCLGLQKAKLIFNISTPGTTYFTFSSIKLYTVPSNVISVPAVLTDTTGGSSTIPINGYGSLLPTIPSGISSYEVRYSVAIPYEYWSCFDTLSFSFRNHCQSLNSVSALIGVSTEAVPCDVSFIADPHASGYIYGSVFVDVSSLVKADYSESLFIYINSSVGVNSGNFLVSAVNGHLFTDSVDPLTVFLQLINSNLDSIYVRTGSINTYLLNIRNYLSNTLTPNLQSVIAELSSIDDRLASIYTRLGNINSSLSSIKTTISNFQASVETDWDTLLDTKLPSFYALLGNMYDTIESTQDAMISWFGRVSSQLQELIEGQPVDESVVEDMEQSEDELGSMTQEMGSMSPDVDAGDVDVNFSGLTDPSASSTVNQIFITITSNETISSFILIVVSLALVGYVFFGKR